MSKVKRSFGVKWPAWWKTYLSLILVAIVLSLSLCNIEYYPPTWFDEGWHLLVAKALALKGQYRFGPAIGPTVFFPIAAMFRVAGVGLLQARLVMAAYLLLTAYIFHALVRYLHGTRTALVAVLLFVSSPGVNLLRWGRQALGEVPAALFFLAASLVWLRAIEKRGRRKVNLILAGVLLGLAILTKNQLLLLVPAWLALWIANRLYFRQCTHSDFLLPLLCATCCVIGWYVGQRSLFSAGQQLAQRNVEEWSGSLSRGILTFSPHRALDGIKFLTGQDAFYAWALPAWLYVTLLSLRRNKAGLRQALFALTAAVWFAWFVLLSVGWPRYAFLPLTLTAIFVAQLFHDLTDGFRLPVKELRAAVRAGHWDLAAIGRLALLGLLAIMILRPLQARFDEVVSQRNNSPQAMAAYITTHVEPEAQIETWEPEVCFLTGYKCHFPPMQAMDEAIKYVWYDAPPPSEYYNFLQYGAQYLLIGDFGRWTHLYDPDVVSQHFELCTSIGNYELYRMKAKNEE